MVYILTLNKSPSTDVKKPKQENTALTIWTPGVTLFFTCQDNSHCHYHVPLTVTAAMLSPSFAWRESWMF